MSIGYVGVGGFSASLLLSGFSYQGSRPRVRQHGGGGVVRVLSPGLQYECSIDLLVCRIYCLNTRYCLKDLWGVTVSRCLKTSILVTSLKIIFLRYHNNYAEVTYHQ